MRLTSERHSEIRAILLAQKNPIIGLLACELLGEIDELRKEIVRLQKVIANELCENDELGCEYTYVNVLRNDLLERSKEMYRYKDALEKIADKYTELGCVMNIANEALKCD